MAPARRLSARTRVTLEQHRQRAQAVFGKLPCKIQAKVSIAQMDGKNVVFVAGTGSGKTYTFWLPLLHDETSIVVVISPLNVLASKQAEDVTALEAAGIRAIALDGETCSEKNITDVMKGVYRVVIMPPELVDDTRLARLWNSTTFTSRLARLVFDEAHCLSEWGLTFRAAYVKAAQIRWRLPDHVRIYLASATMPDDVLQDCMRIVGLGPSDTTIIRCSNDRPNIRLTVRPIKYSQTSMADLAFLIPRQGDSFVKPPKFMLFCNTRKETERAAKYLRRRMGRDLQDKVVWFHSGMSKEFREKKFDEFKEGKLWGMACTDAAGMGLDVSDIDVVVQWKATPSLCTLWQRFGRAARDPEREGEGILLVEKSFIRDEQTKKRKRPSDTRDKDDTLDLGSSDSEAEDGEDGTRSGNAPAEASTSAPAASQPAAAPATTSAAPAKAPAKKRRRVEVKPAMEKFINPCSCRRGETDDYFGNKTVAEQEFCCPRCAPKAIRVCCDKCCPSQFDPPALDPRDRPERQQRRKKARFEPYARNEEEKGLKQKLFELRKEHGAKEFGARPWAGEAFLSDEMVDLVVDLAHQHALRTVDDVRYHTSWVFSDEYGQLLVDAAVRFVPLPAPAPAPPPPPPAAAAPSATPRPVLGNITNAPTPSASAKPPRKKTSCKTCGMLGHNSANRNCPGSREAAAALLMAGASTPAQLTLLRAAGAEACSTPISTTLPRNASVSRPPAHSPTRSVSPDWEAAALALRLTPEPDILPPPLPATIDPPSPQLPTPIPCTPPSQRVLHSWTPSSISPQRFYGV